MPNKSFNLKINIDCLSMFKSSSYQFTPLLASMHELGNTPFIIGLFYGPSQLSELNDFLQDFINGVQVLKKDGIHVGNKIFSLNIHSIICDAQQGL